MWEEFPCAAEIKRLAGQAALLAELKRPTQSLADSIFRCYIQHQRLKDVVDYLRRIGSRTKGDRAWTVELVSNFMFEDHPDVNDLIINRAWEIHGRNSSLVSRRYN